MVSLAVKLRWPFLLDGVFSLLPLTFALPPLCTVYGKSVGGASTQVGETAWWKSIAGLLKYRFFVVLHHHQLKKTSANYNPLTQVNQVLIPLHLRGTCLARSACNEGRASIFSRVSLSVKGPCSLWVFAFVSAYPNAYWSRLGTLAHLLRTLFVHY